MGTRKVIIIGGSAGALEPLIVILKQLKPDFKWPIIIVLHRLKNVESGFVEVLMARTGKKNVKEIDDKEEIVFGKIYVAPANYHVLVEDNETLSLDYSEAVNYSRPSIDVAFESFADTFGSSLVGVLLSGSNADGAKGLHRIEHKGGMVFIQDPASADSTTMPEAAIALNSKAIVAAPVHISELLNQLV